jgi:hypothetical protein
MECTAKQLPMQVRLFLKRRCSASLLVRVFDTNDGGSCGDGGGGGKGGNA